MLKTCSLYSPELQWAHLISARAQVWQSWAWQSWARLVSMQKAAPSPAPQCFAGRQQVVLPDTISHLTHSTGSLFAVILTRFSSGRMIQKWLSPVLLLRGLNCHFCPHIVNQENSRNYDGLRQLARHYQSAERTFYYIKLYSLTEQTIGNIFLIHNTWLSCNSQDPITRSTSSTFWEQVLWLLSNKWSRHSLPETKLCQQLDHYTRTRVALQLFGTLFSLYVLLVTSGEGITALTFS